VSLRSWARDLRERMQERAERGDLGRWRRSVVEPVAGRVLDVGIGMGFDLPWFRRAATVIGVDPDADALRRAWKRAARSSPRVALVAADAEALPFRDRAFDAAVATLAFCTIPRPERALAELRRVVRPGGPVRMLEHVRLEHPVWGRLQDWVTPLTVRFAGGCHQNRRTVETVRGSGLELLGLRPHARGYLVEIDARVPAADATAP
jgi:ubiquinone/menaquinone biosynthesis C-methylase UbiE